MDVPLTHRSQCLALVETDESVIEVRCTRQRQRQLTDTDVVEKFCSLHSAQQAYQRAIIKELAVALRLFSTRRNENHSRKTFFSDRVELLLAQATTGVLTTGQDIHQLKGFILDIDKYIRLQEDYTRRFYAHNDLQSSQHDSYLQELKFLVSFIWNQYQRTQSVTKAQPKERLPKYMYPEPQNPCITRPKTTDKPRKRNINKIVPKQTNDHNEDAMNDISVILKRALMTAYDEYKTHNSQHMGPVHPFWSSLFQYITHIQQRRIVPSDLKRETLAEVPFYLPSELTTRHMLSELKRVLPQLHDVYDNVPGSMERGIREMLVDRSQLFSEDANDRKRLTYYVYTRMNTIYPTAKRLFGKQLNRLISLIDTVMGCYFETCEDNQTTIRKMLIVLQNMMTTKMDLIQPPTVWQQTRTRLDQIQGGLGNFFAIIVFSDSEHVRVGQTHSTRDQHRGLLDLIVSLVDPCHALNPYNCVRCQSRPGPQQNKCQAVCHTTGKICRRRAQSSLQTCWQHRPSTIDETQQFFQNV